MDQQGGRVVGSDKQNSINNSTAPLRASPHLNGISRANKKAPAQQSNGASGLGYSGLPDNANDFRLGLTPSYGYERPLTAQDMREQEIEYKYKETLKKIPNKKPVNDPWAGVRAVPVADRHRPM